MSGWKVAARPPPADLAAYMEMSAWVSRPARSVDPVPSPGPSPAEVAARYALGDDVRRLLTAENLDVGRLEVHLQPVVDLMTGAAVSAEALVRWRHPVRGLLTPDAFLELVASHGLDTRLDTAVLRATVAHLRRWQDEDRPVLPVSVNLTGASLDDPDLVTTVLTVLADAGVPATSLRLEITEQDEVDGAGPAARSLRELRAAGIVVLLDDYGTGFTSLDYLRRFPIRILKLDRSLVSPPPPRADVEAAGPTVPDVLDRADIVAAVTAMAAHLGLQVIAEGVETPAQQAELLALGVRHAQGYLFSRPLPADAFAATWLSPSPASTGRRHAVEDMSPLHG
ncbi:MAG: EAL domain-containing protein [Propionibacteriaceae bacterium]|nr:MAG: EAL domain-containing protein [Propionibacteriaceae bacterium]